MMKYGWAPVVTRCSNCLGWGTINIYDEECPKCEGSGTIYQIGSSSYTEKEITKLLADRLLIN